MRDRRIDDWAMWSSLIVYFIIWVLAPILYVGTDYWYVGVILGLVYVTMHYFEITIRGHCYLSADSTAFPVALIAAILFYLVARMAWPHDKGLQKAFQCLNGLTHAKQKITSYRMNSIEL